MLSKKSTLLVLLGVSLGAIDSSSGLSLLYGGCGSPVGSSVICAGNCTNVKPQVDRSLRQVYLDGPLFVNFLPFSDEALELDNVCFTLFPTVCNFNHYVYYISTGYKNGTNRILTYIITQDTLGILKSGGPDCNTFNDTVIGTDQCGTYVNYRCYPCEGCTTRIENGGHPVYGLTTSYRPIPPDCLQQSLQVIQANGVPSQQYLALPMRMSPRCITKQPCDSYPSPCCDTETSV